MSEETYRETTADPAAAAEDQEPHQAQDFSGNAEKESSSAEKEEKDDVKAETAEEKEKADHTEADAAADAGDDAAAQAEEEAGADRDGDKAGAAPKKDARDLKIEELTDKYRRLFAEFDNYRKRTDAEKSSMFADGQRNILEKILPVIDNFERAAGSTPEEIKGNAYADGVEKVCRGALETLKSLGVEPIEAVGKPFDANLHNAVMHVEDEEHGENEVIEEFQRGYRFKDKVLRYSMVKVAN